MKERGIGMNAFIFTSVILAASAALAQSGQKLAEKVDWSNPPLACIENIIPHASDRACPDLSRVEDMTKEIKDYSSEEEEAYWSAPENRKGFAYCRSLEILKREEANPGSQTPGSVQISWMRATAVDKSEQKLQAIVNSANKYKIPAFVLLGALLQESMLSDLGISDDGGNFSCGAGQVNILEWCRWANKQSLDVRKKLAWQADPVQCSSLDNEWVRPFHEIAMKKLNGQRSYRLSPEHFKQIAFNDVKSRLGGKTEREKLRNFSIVQSFINNCSNPLLGIEAKAHELSELFRLHIPQGIKDHEVYKPGQAFVQNCKVQDRSGFYPLHTGWLLAVASYNAGPRATEVYAHYYNLKKEEAASATKMNFLNPRTLLQGLYFGGKYNSVTDRFDFTTLAGANTSNPVFKQCVMHQHVARIVQHVTAPYQDALLLTLNGTDGCKKDLPVPDFRRNASGRQ